MTGAELAAECDRLRAELGLLMAGCNEQGETIDLEEDDEQDDDEDE